MYLHIPLIHKALEAVYKNRIKVHTIHDTRTKGKGHKTVRQYGNLESELPATEEK